MDRSRGEVPRGGECPEEELVSEEERNEQGLEEGTEDVEQGQVDLDGEEFDAERALATIRQQRESERDLAKQLREARAELKKAAAAEEKRKRAEMDEVERLRTEAAEKDARLQALEQEMETLILRGAVERTAAALGFHNPEDAYGLADLAEITIEDGEVSGVEKALKALAKARPYLIKSVEKPDVNSAARGGGKQEPDQAGIARRFGI